MPFMVIFPRGDREPGNLAIKSSHWEADPRPFGQHAPFRTFSGVARFILVTSLVFTMAAL
jgi:hypothetical protein